MVKQCYFLDQSDENVARLQSHFDNFLDCKQATNDYHDDLFPSLELTTEDECPQHTGDGMLFSLSADDACTESCTTAHRPMCNSGSGRQIAIEVL